jgi:hypothetical protein
MKSVAELKPEYKKTLYSVYKVNSYSRFTLLKLYKKNGLKAKISLELLPDEIIFQSDIYPHPYFPQLIPSEVEILTKIQGNEKGTKFIVNKLQPMGTPVILIRSTWEYGESISIVDFPMIYNNPDIFKPIYVL